LSFDDAGNSFVFMLFKIASFYSACMCILVCVLVYWLYGSLLCGGYVTIIGGMSFHLFKLGGIGQNCIYEL